MLFAKIIDNAVEKFPYILEDLQRDNKNISFPSNIFEDVETLKEYNVYPLIEVDPPAVPNPLLYTTILTNPESIDGKWYQKWDIVPTGVTLLQIIDNKKQQILKEVQTTLDMFARNRGYDNILSCCSYSSSTNEKFRQEAEYCIKLRDYVWIKTEEKLNELQQNLSTNWLDMNPPYIINLIVEDVKQTYNINLDWT